MVEKYQITNITGMDLIRLAKSSVPRTSTEVKAAIYADPDGSLPASRNEANNISKLFRNKKLYVGSKASLTEFKSMIGDVNFIHLATHAVLNPDTPDKSYIQFADGKKWYYSDMFEFDAENLDSIVLSACSTAVKPSSNGSEIESMAYQLLKKSPSGSVVASFWNVDDGATSAFMQEYYQQIINSIKKDGSLDRGGALRKAQLKLLKNATTASPFYWAAFTLFGDFR